MRFIFLLALIAQLAVQLGLALPILTPPSTLASRTGSPDGSLDVREGILYRRAVGAGAVKALESSSKAKVATEITPVQTKTNTEAIPAQPKPAAQLTPAQPQEKTRYSNTYFTNAPKAKAPTRFTTHMSSKEKNQAMAVAYQQRASQELKQSAAASRFVRQRTSMIMGEHSRMAMQHLRQGNMRDAYRHTKQVAKTGVIGAKGSTVPLAKGLVGSARARGAALKYRVKQWNSPSYGSIDYSRASVKAKADQVRNTTPGLQSSDKYLRNMWGYPTQRAAYAAPRPYGAVPGYERQTVAQTPVMQ